MRVLVCGDRKWVDEWRIKQVLVNLVLELPGNTDTRPGITCIIEGEAPGADLCARAVAEELGIPVLPFPAKWKEHGKAAGPIRNRQMLKEGKPDLVLAFHNDISKSKGTADMIAAARAAGLEVRLYTCYSVTVYPRQGGLIW